MIINVNYECAAGGCSGNVVCQIGCSGSSHGFAANQDYGLDV